MTSGFRPNRAQNRGPGPGKKWGRATNPAGEGPPVWWQATSERPARYGWPAGSGRFKRTELVKDRRITRQRNPHYHGEPFPCEGMPGDHEKGLLAD